MSNGLPISGAAQERDERQKVLGTKQMGRRLRNHELEEKQVEDAIRVTEERLLTLKDAVKKKRAAAAAAQKEERK